MRCANCQYFTPSDRIGNGWCRRYPPVVVKDMEGTFASRFPDTKAGEYCGEHETKLEMMEG